MQGNEKVIEHLNKILSNELRARMIGDASYGQWASISRIDEMIYKLPLRVLYFLFSPFPWDIQKPTHLIGTFDGFLFLILFYFVFKNRKAILNDPFLIIAVIILLVYFISFAIGVSNFGAGIRHRSKFVMEIALLAGPLIQHLLYANMNLRYVRFQGVHKSLHNLGHKHIFYGRVLLSYSHPW